MLRASRPTAPLVLFRYGEAIVLSLALLLSLALGRGVIWAAYLTHWTMLLQAGYGVASALATWHRASDDQDTALRLALPYGRTVSYAVSCTVTLLYWFAVHDWDAPLAAMSVVEHGLGYFVLSLDVFTSVAPPACDAGIVRAAHLWAVYGSAMLYVVWSLLFYLSGMTDGAGHRYLYSVLDWGDVPRVLVLLVLVFVCILPGATAAARGLQILGMGVAGPLLYEDGAHAPGGGEFVLVGEEDGGAGEV